MILQALCEYYARKTAADPDSTAPPGFEWKEIPFILELDTTGRLIQIQDTREGIGKKKSAKRFLVPQAPKKAVNIATSLLWGNAEYGLGAADPQKLKAQEAEGQGLRYEERLLRMHAAFVEKIGSLPESAKGDPGVIAVMTFLGKLVTAIPEGFQNWLELTSTNSVMSFRLQGDLDLVCQREAVRSVIRGEKASVDRSSFCSITGEADQIERLHPAIKGVWGAQTSGANIVSFNLDAFKSYGKEQGANAPIGQSAAFSYTTALNSLLAKDSTQRLQIGDTSTVFWSAKPSPLETAIVDIFGEPPKDDPDRNTRAVKAVLDSPKTGVHGPDIDFTRFFVLGLAPNAARIAVRFWHVDTVSGLASNIRRHFDDLAIVRAEFEPQYFSLFRLLVSTAVLGKADNILPNLTGDVVRSILLGLPYPRSLLQAVLRRVRAEQAKKDQKGRTAPAVSYVRAALIKACLNRDQRFSLSDEKELTVSLDENNVNIGYRLGRLFAVLEKIQEEASPGINATIRDRFYGSASSTPVTVFSNLMKLKNHHLAKMENRGRVVNLERIMGAIVGGVTDFPAHLSLQDQGRFAIGYYHQRQAFFNKAAGSA